MTGTAAEICLSYRGVEKCFGAVKALKGIDLDIFRNEIFGFIGPDGAGKTTLIRVAMGIVGQDRGECRLLGQKDRKRARASTPVMCRRFSVFIKI